MILLPIETIQVNQEKLKAIDVLMRDIYRLIIFSRYHLDDDLLDIYLLGIHDLKEQLEIKNAQMEAQSEEEAMEYLTNMKKSLNFVMEEITDHQNFKHEIQLFQLLRIVSPETQDKNPNKYRQNLVQVGAHLCPHHTQVPFLVSELFYLINKIKNPIIRAIYLHHELIRIHPFSDGNGRVTRVAKNWMLMYDLYPPIFIQDADQKIEYIETLSKSFMELSKTPNQWNQHTEDFFEQEIDRLVKNTQLLYDKINKIGQDREKKHSLKKDK